MDEKQEIQSLRRELEQANYEYYVLDNPSMSDYDFDHKLRRLEELEAAHPELVTPDSPTQRVGGKVADGFQEVRHRIPLESLQDCLLYTSRRGHLGAQRHARAPGALPGKHPPARRAQHRELHGGHRRSGRAGARPGGAGLRRQICGGRAPH